jgi:hypothetical protein
MLLIQTEVNIGQESITFHIEGWWIVQNGLRHGL